MKIEKKEFLVPRIKDEDGEWQPLPNNENELKLIKETLENTVSGLKEYWDEAIKNAKKIHGADTTFEHKAEQLGLLLPPLKCKRMVQVVSGCLDLLGSLSQPFFDCRPDLEERYNVKYAMKREDVMNGLANPDEKFVDVAKEYYLAHTSSLHLPYDKLKNRCFDLLFKLDPAGVVQMELAE